MRKSPWYSRIWHKSDPAGKTGNTSHSNVASGHYATGGSSSSTSSCLLVNETNQTIYLRDKLGLAYGNVRYTIPGNSQIEVAPLQHTFFKMILYAIEEEDSGGGGSTNNRVSRSKKEVKDTSLTIDTDQIADHKKIVIQNSSDGSGRYELVFS